MANAAPSTKESATDEKAGDVWAEVASSEPSELMSVYLSYDDETRHRIERQLRRKIDTRILPLVVLIYLFNFMDRNSISQARLYGLAEDTHLKGAEYQTAISIFSAGYILMQIPSTIMMTKLRPSIFLPSCIMVWAIVSGCTSAVSSPAGLMVVRLCLGFVEAPFFPGSIYFLSSWYTKREIGTRIAVFICAILLSNAFAGLISAGILSGMDGVGHLKAWRWLFILEGLATFVLGAVSLFVLPDYPGTTKWLNDAEKIVAQGRLALDAGSSSFLEEEKVPLSRGIWWAVKDRRTWLFSCLQLAMTAALSFVNYFPTIIEQLGFKDSTKVLLLTAPPNLVAFCWAIGLAWLADKHQTRSIPAGVSVSLSMIGTILLMTVTDSLWARYCFTFFLCCGVFGVYSTTYAWLSSTLSQPPLKRAVAIGIANFCANLAALFSSYYWLDKYGPTYRVSWGCVLAFQFLALGCILTLRFLLGRANKRFEELAGDGNTENPEFMARLDTDEKKAVRGGFRYVI